MKRIESLDALRAFAVLLVIGHHAAFRFRPDSADPIAAVFKNTGWIGVDIFFVISGYLITSILLRGDYDLRTFFRRRAFRILPIFIVAICIFIIAALVTDTDRELLGRMWSPALLLNGWTIPFFGYGNVPYTITWSLSVEETAYLFLGLAGLFGPRGLRMTVFAMLMVAITLRIAAVATGFVDLTDLYFFVPARLDAIAMGGAVAFGYFARVGGNRLMRLFSGLTVVFLIWAYQFQPVGGAFLPLAGYLLFSCAMAVFIASLTGERSTTERAMPRLLRLIFDWLVSFGKVSYFIYLFHIFFLEALLLIVSRTGLEKPGFWVAFSITIAVVHLSALISWKYFEYPLIQRGRRDALMLRGSVS
jgi:peptidoglycan/LPS O-acetylase OafA/YrhL